MNKKVITSSILIILLIILIAFGVSYAYFQANVFGNETSNTISAGGATLKIEYASDSTITANNIVPGWSDTKYFQVKVTNTKQETINYNINLVISNSNFYTTDTKGNSYLTYHLYECTSSSDTTCSTELSTQTIIDINGSGTKTLKQITNTKSETKYYALKIEFPNQNNSQTQEGIDDNPLTFDGYVTINSSNKYSYKGAPITEYISKLDKESNGLEVDDTDDQNLRYVGSTPNNYISFNNETWRIIGVFNVYNNDTNKTEKLVKIIRNDSLGIYSWDTSSSSINSGYGVNEWSQADLMTELNTDYIDTSKISGTTTWYDGTSNTKSGSYDYSKNIKSGYIDKIANVRWNLGGSGSSSNSVKSFYTLERGTTHISNPSDEITRTNTWNGKVGLMYPSDYGYATTDTSCRNNINSSNCKNNNWLFNSAYQWTLSPSSSYAFNVFDVYPSGGVSYNFAYYPYGVRPTLFLKSDTLINGGNGTETNPYTIYIEDFSNASWDTIANNVKQGKANLYAVGSEKEVEIDGKSYTVRVANNTTPDECNGSDFSETACGFVVEFVDIVEERQINKSSMNQGGWPSSYTGLYSSGTFFNKLPSDLQSVIIDTKVVSGHGRTSGEKNFTSNGKIYLLSAKEIFNDGDNNEISEQDTASNNTRQLDYYSSKGVTTSNTTSAIKQYYDENFAWWLRSAYIDDSYSFHYIGTNGKFSMNYSSVYYGFAPAFRIG